MPVTKWSISFTPEVAKELEKRIDVDGERSMRVSRQIDRYFAILRSAHKELRKLLSDGEIGLILDVMNGVAHYDTYSIQLVWANVDDSLEDGYADKWEVDGPALVQKLRNLDYASTVALVDACEMWWNRVGKGEQPHHSEALN